MGLGFAFLTGLVLLGSISPLLTFTALFQQKEWRLDRLMEHLRREGVIGQLFGKTRPALFIFYVGAYLIVNNAAGTAQSHTDLWTFSTIDSLLFFGTLAAYALLSIAQIALHKQRMPVWTSKAKLIIALSLIVTALIGWFVFSGAALLPIAQPLIVLLAWLILTPLDAYLKKAVMHKGALARSSLVNATVIGIAGSVGKTTTKELLHHLLQDKKPFTTPAHVNTEMGVAAWLQRIAPDASKQSNPLLIVEMGAYRKGEIKLLCQIAQPTIGVITALGSDHLALFGSEEAIVQANGELVEALPAESVVYLNGDNEGSRSLARLAPYAISIVGESSDAQFRAMHIEEAADGLHFYWQSTGQTTPRSNEKTFVPLHGKHNITNILLAMAVARHMDVSYERIEELLKSFHPTAHTFNVRTESGVTLLDDTYNISPLSFKAALNWAADRTERPRVLLTSGLQETGSDEKRFLTELGTLAASTVERVIFTTDRGAKIFEAAYGKPVEILAAHTERVSSGSALLCVGRMPLSSIQRLLPLS